MSGARRRSAAAQGGMSLLEVLVALVIMAMALGLLYRSSGGSVRAVVGADAAMRAAMLAQTVLATHDTIPPAGWNEEGDTDAMHWTVTTSRLAESPNIAQVPNLYRVRIDVAWQGSLREQHFELTSILPEQRKILGAGQ